MNEQTKLIGFTVLVVAFTILCAAIFLNWYYKNNFAMISGREGKAVPRHFVQIEMASTAGDCLFEIGLKVGFSDEKRAQKCKNIIPRLKNDILMLDLKSDIETNNMTALKSKISAVICKNCPGSEENVFFEKFLTR